MGAKSQRKGRAGELELSGILQEHGFPVKPGIAQSYGTEPDLYGLPKIHIEVKRVEALNLTTAMSQAIRDAGKFNDGLPTVFHRKNRQPWLVSMRLDDWFVLYDAFLSCEQFK